MGAPTSNADVGSASAPMSTPFIEMKEWQQLGRVSMGASIHRMRFVRCP